MSIAGLSIQAPGVIVGTDGDGLGDLGEGNLISGNDLFGLTIGGAEADGVVVAGNTIGTDPTGFSRVSNRSGVNVYDAPNVRIGTNGDGVSDLAEANLISGNRYAGIEVNGPGATGAVIAGNLIGPAAPGAPLSTLVNSTGLSLSSPQARIGTNGDGVADDLEGNVIVAGRNGTTNCPIGVFVNGAGAAGAVIAGNTVQTAGLDYFGTGICSSGIAVRDARGIRIGSNWDGVSDEGEANRIQNSSRTGVYVEGADALVSILGNSIRGNGLIETNELGIDLVPDAVTLNDALDMDGGPNGLQNFPVLTSAVSGVGVTFALASTPSTTFRVEAFANAVPDASGHGQGDRFIGAAIVTTDASGNASGTISATSITEGEIVSATATPLDPTTASGFGGTSEFAANLTVEDGPVVSATSIYVDGPRGYRYLGAPASGVTVDDLAVQNLVRGVPGYYPAASPANLFTRYDADKGTWLPSSGTGETLRLGYAFRWTFYDNSAGNPDISVSRPLPFTLSTDRAANTDDVIVELNTTGSRWSYLANPFGQPIDLIDADTWPGYFGISSPAYVYDPVSRSWEDAPTVLQPWEAVRVRSKGPRIDGGGRSLRIPASAQVPTGGLQSRRAETPALAFRLDGTDTDGLPLADAAFTVAFEATATVGLDDEVDVAKLQAPSTQYVMIGSRVGGAFLGYDVRPFADAEIPLALDARGAGSDLTLRWDATTLPEGLPVVLVDLTTGAEVDVRTQTVYTFEAASAPALDAEPAGDLADLGDATDRFVLRIGERVATAPDDDATRALRLETLRPNPSSGTARVTFVVPEAGAVRLAVVDMRGREVAMLVDGSLAAGRHEAQVGAGALAAGVYVVRLAAGGDVQTRRLVVVR